MKVYVIVEKEDRSSKFGGWPDYAYKLDQTTEYVNKGDELHEVVTFSPAFTTKDAANKHMENNRRWRLLTIIELEVEE